MVSKKSILIVEDEYLIASDLARSLGREGYAVIGPASSIGRALELIEATPPDAALLDIRLIDEESYPVADKLAATGIPFVFFTSFPREDLPSRFSKRPLVSKLSDFKAVASALSNLGQPEA